MTCSPDHSFPGSEGWISGSTGPGSDTPSSPNRTPTDEGSSSGTGPESPSTTTSGTWRLTEEQKTEAVRRYEAGESCAVIATLFGVSRQSMWDVLRRRTKMRPRIRKGSANPFYRGGSKAVDAAQNKLEKATQRGTVKRPEACERCGSSYRFKDGRTAIQGHHPDYTKPLSVIWLCQRCHHDEHRKEVS